MNAPVRRRLRRPSVATLRHRLERALAPFVHGDVAALRQRVDAIDADVRELRASVAAIERHLAALLSAVAAANGTAELARQEIASLRATGHRVVDDQGGGGPPVTT